MVHEYRHSFGLPDLLTIYMSYYSYNTIHISTRYSSLLHTLVSHLSISWQQEL